MDSTTPRPSSSGNIAAAAVAPPERARIVSTPDICGGRPRITGTRIQVKPLAVMHNR